MAFPTVAEPVTLTRIATLHAHREEPRLTPGSVVAGRFVRTRVLGESSCACTQFCAHGAI